MRFDSYDFTKYGTINGSINKIAPQEDHLLPKIHFNPERIIFHQVNIQF